MTAAAARGEDALHYIGAMESDTPLPQLDQLATPLVWACARGLIAGVNPAFCRWLGISARRLAGQPLVALEAHGEVLAQFIARNQADRLRLDRLALALPG